MRQALESQTQGRGQPTAAIGVVTSPVGGWNARDAIDQMEPTDALQMDNWYPDRNAVRVRDGYSQHASGVGSGVVKTTVEYFGQSSRELIACSDTNIYCATAAATATSLASGFTNGMWQTQNFHSYLFLVNGSDTPQRYDGTNVTAPLLTAATGLSLSAENLVNVGLVNNRLWFAENNKAAVWYLGAGDIQGTLNQFDLSQIARGGSCTAIGSWSVDSGDGMDDFHVFVMSTGEVLVYAGDPSSTFTLQGRYSTGEPIGRRCLVKQGGELIIITRSGYMPLSAVMSGRNMPTDAVSDKIRDAAATSSRFYYDNVGWQAFLSPTGEKLFFTIPTVVDGDSEQHVMNTVTLSWCRFTYPASSFGAYNGDIYFGGFSGGIVYKITGSGDNGANIQAIAKTAFTGLGSDNQYKKITGVKMHVATDGDAIVSVGVNADYANSNFATPNTTLDNIATGATWDAEEWDVASWGSPPTPQAKWVSQGVRGRKFSVRFELQTQAETADWYRTDFKGQQGGLI